MAHPLFKIYNFLGRNFLEPLLKKEQIKRPFPEINERPVEYAFAFKHLRQLCTGPILDIGPGQSSWPHLLSICGYKVVAVDKIGGYWNSFFNRHYKVLSDDITNLKLEDKFQFVTCLSTLEHILDHRTAVKGMHDALEVGGYLILTVPYNELFYHSNIYEHPEAGYGQSAKYIAQVFSRKEVDSWLAGTSFEIVDQEYSQVFTGDYWTMGEKIIPSLAVGRTELHQHTCLLLQRTS